MSKWIAEFELEDGDKMPEHMDLEYHGVKLDFHCRPLEQKPCEDAVSRKSVITIIQNHWWNCRDIDKLVNELPPVTPQESRWIPVSERMPKPNRLVLCYITTGATETYFLALWNDTLNAWEEGIGGYRLLENDLGYEVIAWMPLPEPYKVESEE